MYTKHKKPEQKADETQKQNPNKGLPNVKPEYLECDQCFKRFKSGPSAQGNLNRHKKLHTSYKRIECNVCHKTFNNKSNFQNHLHQHDGQLVDWKYTTEGARQQPTYTR